MTVYPSIHDVLDRSEMEAMIRGGYLRRQRSDDGLFSIVNYTERAQFDGVWNNTTLMCRGLIVDEYSQLIVARPFPKFFNLDEHNRETVPNLDPTGPVHVTDKLDGSLGILFEGPTGNPQIATRGSFVSDQAIHANAVWAERYSSLKLEQRLTYLFEIVYPGNRIVVDYGETDDLFLLGANVITTGQFVPPEDLYWPGPSAELFGYETLTEALASTSWP